MNCVYTHAARFPMDYFNPMAFMNYRMPRPRNLKLGYKQEVNNTVKKPEEKSPLEPNVVEAECSNREEAVPIADHPQ